MKAEIDVVEFSIDEIKQVLTDFGFNNEISNYVKLFGGYSGSSYKIELLRNVESDETDLTVVLRFCNGYDSAWTESQCVVQDYAHSQKFNAICFPYPRRIRENDENKFRFTSLVNKTPACLISFLKGVSAAKVTHDNILLSESVVTSVAKGLGDLHSIKSPEDNNRNKNYMRNYLEGGACFLNRHLNGEFSNILTTNEYTRDHPYVSHYLKLIEEIKPIYIDRAGELTLGVIHGDPFLDNALVDDNSGLLCGFVDWEDCCVGPLIFDFAVMVIGSCFTKSNELDLALFANMCKGYSTARILTDKEKAEFIIHMKTGLLCNSTWRFHNFNIVHREIEQCRNSYKELEDRIYHISKPEIQTLVNKVLNEI